MLGKRSLLLVALASVTIALLALAADQKTAPAKDTPWKIQGTLEEACSCNAACPCWFGSKPTKMTCGGGQVLFIDKGTFGDVPLDGLAVGNFVQSPANKSMMESFGNWNFSYTYLDQKATPAQREALKALSNAVLPGAASSKVEYRVVPIERTIAGNEHAIALGKYGKFSGHVIEGGLGGPAKIVNPPGADPLHKEYLQGNTTLLTYNDAGQDWKFEGSNYMLGTFELDSEQYKTYAAGLAQKMSDKKSKM